MSEEQTQPTDAENQADAMGKVDFGDEEQPVETQTADSPDENQTPENESESPINQEAVEKRINKITFEKYEEKRKREAIQAELDQLKAKLEERDKKSEDINVPPMPDPYDDDYADKIKAREAALQQAAVLKAKKDFLEEQNKKAFLDKITKQNAEIQKQVDEMYANAEKHGISKEALQNADAKVANFIKDQSLARFILGQKDAALVINYLSNSATELEKLSSMDPLNASVYIATEISQKAVKSKPKLTKTPDPIDIPKGSAAPKEDAYLKGVSFE